MKNILSLNQPVLDYTLPNLDYISIKTLKQIIDLENEYYNKEIEIIAKTELIGLLNKYSGINYNIEQFKDDDCLSILHKVFPQYC